MSIRKKNKVSRWLARLLILTICLTGVPIKNVYGEGDENNKVTYEWKKTLTHERMGDVEEIQVEYLSPTRDGGFIGIGSDTYSGLVFKLDNSRNVVWVKEYSGFGDEITDIQEKSSGGYVVLENRWWHMEGLSGCNGYIFELDENGEKIPERELQIGGSNRDLVEQIVQTNDGGYIVVGYEDSNDGDFSGNLGDYDCWVLKIDNNFNQVWLKNYGGEGQDKGVSIKEASDGGYVIFGTSIVIERPPDIPRNYSFWVFKIDEAGNVVWDKTYGGTRDDSSVSSDAIKSIDMKLTADGGYALLGSTTLNNGDITGNHGGQEYWFVKINKDGEKQFQKTYGGSGDDSPIGFIKNSDGGYIIAGNSNSSDGDFNENQENQDGWMIQIDESGKIIWKWNAATAQEDTIHSIQAGEEREIFISSKIGGTNEIAKLKVKNTNAYLTDLKVDGQTVSNFVYNKLSYNKELPYGTTTVPTVIGVAQDINAAVDITPAESLPGSTSIEVTAEDGEVTKTYTLAFTVAKNNNAYLQELKVDNTGVSGFSHNQYTYEKELPYGTTTVPTITATAQDTNAVVNITQATSLPGSTSIEVTAENGEVKKTYTIAFTVAKNNN
ncbi:MAG: cadherin-like beta sandwich domain-containing protein, partial [Marinisporobacter sp.]|nr:cadherin-like beta sandwich domain-containing protein [Marinisporobacter sp.]